MPPPPSHGLNVIALISGGKDSLYSILHCIRNGHKVVALANLHPPPPPNTSSSTTQNDNVEESKSTGESGVQEGADDIDSFMYQTIGWGVIPLYEEALGIPLYRQAIVGGAVDTGRVYGDATTATEEKVEGGGGGGDGGRDSPDETESLIPLLHRVMAAHPEANAVCAGAILSTYQRTRIEDVAGRLGLTPLAWLWQYPFLPRPMERISGISGGAETEAGLLEDMSAVGCSARIVKVASGALDESVLWGDVAGGAGAEGARLRGKLVKGMRRFAADGEDIRGAVLGEGGEYETLAVDGPGFLWKGRIEIEEGGREVRVGEGGVAYLRLSGAKVVPKEQQQGDEFTPETVRRPALFDRGFESALEGLWDGIEEEDEVGQTETPAWMALNCVQSVNGGIWTVANITAPEAGPGAGEQMAAIAKKIHAILDNSSQDGAGPRTTADIVFTTVLLRSMGVFPLMNSIYVGLFKKPNPPARATVACGEILPKGVNVMLSMVVDLGPRARRYGLHVQSRSYWAPANIGPYSQAMSIPLQGTERAVYIAGQIPLEPASMELAECPQQNGQPLWAQTYCLRAVLSLQHMWRIGTAMDVNWWLGAVAFFTGRDHTKARARAAWKLWEKMHDSTEEAEQEDEATLDIWDIKYGRRGHEQAKPVASHRIPDLDLVADGSDSRVPGFLAVQVHELPRNSDIEWQGLGYRCEGVKVSRTEAEYGRTTNVTTNENQVYSFIEVDGGASSSDLKSRIQRVLEACTVSSNSCHCVIYSSQPLPQDGFPGQVVPCKSVWGAEGRKLAAGAIVQRQAC
jgi:diphthine-ammonia ligase